MIGGILNHGCKIDSRLRQGPIGDAYCTTEALTGQLTLDAEMAERLRREGETVGQLRHPNIGSSVDKWGQSSLLLRCREAVNECTPNKRMTSPRRIHWREADSAFSETGAQTPKLIMTH